MRCILHACACMYVCMHACIYVCMHVCMYACMHVCMFVCMIVCTFVFAVFQAAREAAELESRANEELELARPVLDRARAAVDCLDKASLTELKSLQKPPEGVDIVMKVVLVMLTNEKKSLTWDNGKRLMSNVGQFKSRLEAFRYVYIYVCVSACVV